MLALAVAALAFVGTHFLMSHPLRAERWHEWVAQTAFFPFSRGLANPGAIALIGGTLFFLPAAWLHDLAGGMPVGLWRWIG